MKPSVNSAKIYIGETTAAVLFGDCITFILLRRRFLSKTKPYGKLGLTLCCLDAKHKAFNFLHSQFWMKIHNTPQICVLKTKVNFQTYYQSL